MIGQGDLAAFITANLRLGPARAVPEIMMWQATPGSRLREASAGRPPYWAYQWAGGTALARFVLDRPETVAGRRVLDLGCGGGIVAIAAARAGAREVRAADIDPAAIAATALNAAANGVRVAATCGDRLDGPAPEADLVLVGDLFYARSLTARVAGFLERCREAGREVLVGDPYRADLPLESLRRLAEIKVPDFGGGPVGASGVFAFDDARRSAGLGNHGACVFDLVALRVAGSDDADASHGRQTRMQGQRLPLIAVSKEHLKDCRAAGDLLVAHSRRLGSG